jgi:hypothetical protein
MPGLPHERLSAEIGYGVKQDLTRLYVGDDRCAGVRSKHIACENRDELVAPNDPSLPIDDPDTVAVAVERDTEIQALIDDTLLQLDQIAGIGRVRVVRRKAPIDCVVQQDMAPGELSRQALHDLSGSAVPGIPGYGQARDVDITQPLQQPIDVTAPHVDELAAVPTRRVVFHLGDPAELADHGAEDRFAADHHLEPVVVGWIVRARNHDASIDIEGGAGEIKHGRRSAADAYGASAGRGDAISNRRLQLRRTQPPVPPDANPWRLPAVAAHHRRKGPTDRGGIGDAKGLSDDAANVVLAQDRRMKPVS